MRYSMLKSLFRTKNIERMQSDAVNAQGMKRTLGRLHLTLFGIGVIVGTGIFVLTGHAAASNAGPAIAISFVLAGFAAGLAGLCYAEMAAMIPVAGSAYTYAYATLGEMVAFIIGWDLILEYLVGAATVSVGWSGYFSALITRLTGYVLPWQWSTAPLQYSKDAHVLEASGAYINLPAILFIAMITVVLTVGVKESARLNAIMVGVKLTAIALFLGFAVSFIDPHHWQPFMPENRGGFGHFGVSGVFQGATMVFFAYVGFDALSTVAQESRNPQRDLPVGMLVSLAVCTTLYVLVSLALTGIVSYTELSVPHPIAIGISVVQRPWLEVLVDIGALAGLTSGALVMLLGQPRIFYAMGQDGLFPRWAARVHPRFGTPHIATIITGTMCAIGGGVLPIEVLGELTSTGTLFAFVVVSIGVIVLRRTRPDAPRTFRVPGGAWGIPLFSALASGGLMFTATPQSLWRLFAWLAVGLLVYLFYSRHRSRLQAQPEALRRAA